MSSRSASDAGGVDLWSARKRAQGWPEESTLLSYRATSWSERVACVGLLAAATGTGGVFGFVAGAFTVAVWYVLGTPYAIAGGHVALLGAFPGGIDPLSLLFLEGGFVALLLAPLLRAPDPGRAVAVALASVAGLGGLAWALVGAVALWLTAGVLLGAIAVAAYALHRYELVRLGLVTDDERRVATTASDSPTDQ